MTPPKASTIDMALFLKQVTTRVPGKQKPITPSPFSLAQGNRPTDNHSTFPLCELLSKAGNTRYRYLKTELSGETPLNYAGTYCNILKLISLSHKSESLSRVAQNSSTELTSLPLGGIMAWKYYRAIMSCKNNSRFRADQGFKMPFNDLAKL